MSSAFFLYVYHNEYADRDSIMSYLAEYETNPGLRSLSTDPTAVREVGLVFEYMEHIGADARVAVWFCFFHDLWTTNHKVSSWRGYREPPSSSWGSRTVDCLPPRPVRL